MSHEPTLSNYDTSLNGFIRWSLDYTMDPIIECFRAIPAEQRFRMVANKIPAPCRILGHIAFNEELLVQGFAQGIPDRRCPFPAWLLDVWAPQIPTEYELRQGIPDSDQLVTYWRDVRTDTHGCLDSLSPEEMMHRPEKSTLPEGVPNRDNPIRELFIMTTQNQNCHWGELRAICKILDVHMRW